MLGIIYDNITIYYYYYYEGSAGARHTDTRKRGAASHSSAKRPRQSRLFGVPLRARAHTLPRSRARVCVCVDARRGRIHVKCPSYFGGAPVASSSSLPLLPPPFNDWRQPGIGSSKLPPPPRSPPPTPNTFTRVQIPSHHLRRRHRRQRRQRRHRRNFARTPLTKRRWREVRARSVYYSKLLSATTGRAPPPVVGVAAASRTRTKRSIGHKRGSAGASTVPSGTRSTVSRVCPWPVRRRRRRRVPSPYARDTLHFVRREITR